MRIIGGTHRGREITTPKGNLTRPMTDRAREALFNILGDISGFRVLDAYAGSGALGLEALSRGAAHATGIESAPAAQAAIKSNLSSLGLENYHLYEQTVEHWLATNQAVFNIIFADPPYHQADVNIFNQLSTHLEPNGLLVIKYSNRENSPQFNGVELIKVTSYADNKLSFYRKT